MEQNQYVSPETQPVEQEICPTSIYEPKPLFLLNGKDMAFSLCTVAVCVFTCVCGLFGGMALGYLLSVVAFFVLFWIYFSKSGKVSLFSVMSALLVLGMGAVFLCTTNDSVRFFAGVLGFLLGLLCFDSLRNGKAVGNHQTLGRFYAAVSSLDNLDVAVKSLFSNENGDKKTVGKVLVGMLCSLPVLFVVVPLLISSDNAFQGLMDSLFSNALTTILKVALGIMLAVPVMAYGFSLKYGRTATLKRSGFAGIESVYVVSFLSVISLCYLLYLFSQLAYFFSAFRGFLPQAQITVSQYARKGFFEMCVIAVINLLLVLGAFLLVKKKEGKVGGAVKVATTFIAGFTLVIIATAISKMVLYIGSFGMTVLRLTTSAFMVFLAVVFISIVLRIYVRRVNVVKTALFTAGLVLLVLGVGNVNRICARYNYEAYMNCQLTTVDVQAMYELGDEGIPYVAKLTYCVDEVVSIPAKDCLAEAYLYDYFEGMESAEGITIDALRIREKNKGFSHFSLPRQAAYESLYRYVQECPGFAEWCWSYASWSGEDTIV